MIIKPLEKDLVSQTEDSSVYHSNDGEVVLTSYEVFPGIQLVYEDIHSQEFEIKSEANTTLIEISHCREGRIEGNVKNEFYYLSPGDISIKLKKDTKSKVFFPSRHYHGLSLLIDIERTPDCLSCFLKDVNVKPVMLMDKFCKKDSLFVMRAKPELEHVFLELYSVPESIRRGYFKVKVLEILLFLSGIDINEVDFAQRCVPNSQVILAKKVCQYLTEHMEQRFTIEALSVQFKVSQTLLKSSFKSVYGTSVYSFVRKQKMLEACLQLKRTNKTIMEIAGNFGYDNGSKFAKAFREVVKVPPSEYRKHEKVDT